MFPLLLLYVKALENSFGTLYINSKMLSTESAIREYLQQQDFQSPLFNFRNPEKIQKIKGGTTNFTFRLLASNIHLEEPDELNVTSAIFKYAAEYAADDPDTPFSSKRQLYEVRAMKDLAAALKKQSSANSSIIKLPEVYFFDDNAHVIIMEDITPPHAENSSANDNGPTYLSMDRMCRSSHPIVTRNIAEQAGSNLGLFSAQLHQLKDEDALLKGLFETNSMAREQDVQTTFGDIPRKLEELGVALEPEKIAVLDEIILDMSLHILNTPESVIMGDFWYVLFHSFVYSKDVQIVETDANKIYPGLEISS